MSAIVIANNKESAEKQLKEMGYMVLSSKTLADKKHKYAMAVKPHYQLFPAKRNMIDLSKKIRERGEGMLLWLWYDNPKYAEENLKFFNSPTSPSKIDRYL
jgi:hypothetical protein